MSNPSFDLEYVLDDPRWEEENLVNQDSVAHALTLAAKLLDLEFLSWGCTLALSNDSEMQNLNRTFRQKDTPTNVLSFPSGEEAYLGDIILGYETTRKEAEELGISLKDHALHLIVHGFLHLLGYDHENEKDALQMESLEIQILHALNIPNPYEER